MYIYIYTLRCGNRLNQFFDTFQFHKLPNDENDHFVSTPLELACETWSLETGCSVLCGSISLTDTEVNDIAPFPWRPLEKRDHGMLRTTVFYINIMSQHIVFPFCAVDIYCTKMELTQLVIIEKSWIWSKKNDYIISISPCDQLLP